MKRLLIVDDAIFMRLSLRIILEKSGFEVVGEACNGLEAIKLYKELKPDIVTMDITMPELDGIDALKIIKRIDKDARIIIISSVGQEVRVKEAVIAGAVAFIVKPFNEKDVVKSIVKTISTK